MESTMSASIRQRDIDDSQDGRSPKRTKLDQSVVPGAVLSTETINELENLLPPSHVLLGASEPTSTRDGSMYRIVEADVGISEYISCDVPKISGIIKQRYVRSQNIFFVKFSAHLAQIHRFSRI